MHSKPPKAMFKPRFENFNPRFLLFKIKNLCFVKPSFEDEFL